MSSGNSETAKAFAEGFVPASREAWKSLVEKALKGADFEKRMVSRTADGLRIDPLYTREDALPSAAMAVPGWAPFVRGTRPMRDGLGWEIRQFHIENDAAAANAAILEDLAGGVNGVGLQIGASGGPGLAPDGATLGRALQDVMLDICPIALVAGERTEEAARSLIGLWDAAGIPEGARRGSFGADPAGDLARTGRLAEPLDGALARAAALAKSVLSMPSVQALRADGVPYHMGGASEAQELAAMLATLVQYLRDMEKAGIAPQVGLAKVEVVLAVDDDQFLGLAKLRAARRLVWRIADACGAAAAVPSLRLTAVTSMRMMARRDPWTNILRTTIACAAAAMGGADSISVLPFTIALGKPDAIARRVARNIQIVCQEESHLGRVADPAGGSWYVEKLTDDLAAKAWSHFQTIESLGGIIGALQSGWLQDEIAAVAEARAKSIATGRMELTGVSAFPLLGDDGAPVEPWPHPAASPSVAADLEIRPLRAVRLAEPFEALRDAADAYAARTGKPLAVFLASIGAVIDHNVRSTWVKNYLAAGGIAADMSDGYASAEEAARAFRASGLAAACICSSDTLNGLHAEATARALKAAGAKLVLMAGRPGENEAALKAAGVDRFLFAGGDAVATLQDLQRTLG